MKAHITWELRIDVVNKVLMVKVFHVENYSLALKSDGTVWSWGENSMGQLGDGTTLGKLTPTQVKAVDGKSFLNDATKIDAGDSHSIALTRSSFITWGNNTDGQLGNGSLISYSNIPVTVLQLPIRQDHEYIYDSANRLSAIIIHKGSISYRRVFVYDSNGNLLSTITKEIQ
ncbi:Regulator of chromosome condensation (RCC1) repeat protein [compost metagenome]